MICRFISLIGEIERCSEYCAGKLLEIEIVEESA